ncbi:transposase [Halalkalibacter sp. APA_J-10(15)]|uniref:transposase n=1 Tax=Halalkalibacter sp. APA_J-10(15) TaxID=2933805 RepID=UPI0034D52E30
MGTKSRGAAKYIGGYLARPAVAECRIESYDGPRMHFWYEDHKSRKRVDAKWPVYRFIFGLLQHIPPKHFRMVGRYGLYSRKAYKKASCHIESLCFCADSSTFFVNKTS